MLQRSVKLENFPISKILRTPRRFFRSTQLERDFSDPRALEDYCLTGFGLNCLSSFAEGFDKHSTRRAWRFTGDYGTGKSSFALLLARCAQGVRNGLPPVLGNLIVQRCPTLARRKFLPILLTGSRETLGKTILRAIANSLSEQMMKALPLTTRASLARSRVAEATISDSEVLNVIETITVKLTERKIIEGILLVLDEAGKFLEHAAFCPESQDVMLLQRLAEFAQRSGDNPFIVVCLFHVAFSSYASQLSPSAQKEWDKVAERFEEIPFAQPLAQTAELIVSALSVQTTRVPKNVLAEGAKIMAQTCQRQWLGSVSSVPFWQTLSPKLFPIDATLLPVLFRFFQKFAQHERSLFNFLFSHEPFGFRAFCQQPIESASWLRIHHFFDYVRSNLGLRLSQASYRTRWPAVEAVLEASADLPELDQQILKTIGLLNILDDDNLRPTEEILALAVAGPSTAKQLLVTHALEKLVKSHRIYFRGKLRGYCVWPYSSVDLDKALDAARNEVSDEVSIAHTIQAQLPQRALVARRHYVETGNLRYFDVEYVNVDTFAGHYAEPRKDRLADGRILIVLCEDEAEHAKALALSQKLQDHLTLIGITRPLRQIQGYVLETLRWEWVSNHTPELNSDRYAKEEVSRQLENARDLLSRRLSEFVGLDRTHNSSSLIWFQSGRIFKNINNGRDLLRELSNICDKEFVKSPQICNELINRHSPSSAATGARLRLIEGILNHSDASQLNIPEGKHPPELSMYLSVLHSAKLHRRNDNLWSINLPENEFDDPCNWRHVFAYLRAELEKAADKRLSLSKVYEDLSKPPFGLREGLMPLVLAVLFSAHSHELAFYERGNFVPKIDLDMFLRLSKVPEIFELQWCRIDGLRAEILNDLRQLVSLAPIKSKRTHLLEIVRPLCRFVVDLPEYTKRTRQLSPQAIAIRDALFNTREPIKLLMYQLPEACGLPSFTPGTTAKTATARHFVRQLNIGLQELNEAYNQMLNRLEKRLALQFRLGEGTVDKAREQIMTRAQKLKPHLREPRLTAFANALSDGNLLGSKWIASIASTSLNKTPVSWDDIDEGRFDTEISGLVGSFLRVERLHFGDLTDKKKGQAFRVAITQADGDEVAEVLHFVAADEPSLQRLERKLDDLFSKEGDLALIATARQLSRRLSRDQNI